MTALHRWRADKQVVLQQRYIVSLLRRPRPHVVNKTFFKVVLLHHDFFLIRVRDEKALHILQQVHAVVEARVEAVLHISHEPRRLGRILTSLLSCCRREL